MSDNTLTRRDFLKLAGTTGAAVVVLGARSAVRAQATGEGPESEHRWAMVIDQAKCIGCGYCTLACRASNDVREGMEWNVVLEDEHVGGEPVFLPRPCMHCEHPPCAEVCPVGATYKRGDGIVMMDYDKCIGCRYCEVACPYGARVFNWEKFEGENSAVPKWGTPEVERRPRGVPEKCSFCYQRIDRGLALGLTPGVDHSATPACVNACPVGARIFGDLNNPNSEVSLWLGENESYR
ncbi:MAG: 4Fe-4S dicluster domain-containing protein, partial [Chloroflexota bacterium]